MTPLRTTTIRRSLMDSDPKDRIAIHAPETSDRSLVSTEELYRYLVESLTEYAIFATSDDGRIVSWNSGAEHLFGYVKAEVIDRNFDIIFTAEDRIAGAPQLELETARTAGRVATDCWHVRKDSSLFWATNIVQPIRDDDGNSVGFTKIVRDGTDRKVAIQALQDSQQRFQLLVETVREYAMFGVSSSGNVSFWNAGAEAVFGYRSDEIVGFPLAKLYAADAVSAGHATTQLNRAAHEGFAHDERWLVRKDGTRFFASDHIKRIANDLDGSDRGFVKMAYNITDRKAAEDATRHLAMHDSLTGLPNRVHFIERLRSEIADGQSAERGGFAVFFLDVDDFKLVNDSFGHSIADKLLQALATRLASCLRSGDLLARLGGDEFAILLIGTERRTDADTLVKRIARGLSKPFEVDRHEFFVTMSVGVALDTARYSLPEEALRDADIAMYASKAKGRGQITIFESAMHEPIVARQRLDTQLRHGLERDEFRVVYQPIVDLADMQTVGFEALVRWQHPTRGLLGPADFLEAARETESIIAIDRFVLLRACIDASTFLAERGSSSFLLSVNMTSRQFEFVDFVPYVSSVLHETGFDPSCLKLEITEGTMMAIFGNTLDTLARLRGTGIELYIDDFGTGYSSLSYLADLPVNALKIDRSFVEKIGLRTEHKKIIATIIDLAHGLEIKAIAEGIESNEQLEAVRALGCDYAQGFLFSRPVEWSVASASLDRHVDGFIAPLS